jgi:Trk K+ transport system NAD-binding subunit
LEWHAVQALRSTAATWREKLTGRRVTVKLVSARRPDSSYRKKQLAAGDGKLDEATRIFAIVRGEHMMVPRADTVLEAGERLLLLTGTQGLEDLKQHIDKW